MQEQTISNQHDNVDAGEIAKFSQTADKWRDKNGEFKPLHDINPLCLDYIDGYAGLAGKHVLDVGYGGDTSSESVAEHGAEHVTGINTAEEPLQAAATHVASQHIANIDYRCTRVGDLVAEQPHSFNAVMCVEVTEHAPDPAAIIQACAGLVKPDGTAFFSAINRNPKSYLRLIAGVGCLSKFVPKGTHDWKKFITPVELARMCRQARLDTVGSRGMTYNLLSGRYSLCDSTEVNHMVACRPVQDYTDEIHGLARYLKRYVKSSSMQISVRQIKPSEKREKRHA